MPVVIGVLAVLCVVGGAVVTRLRRDLRIEESRERGLDDWAADTRPPRDATGDAPR